MEVNIIKHFWAILSPIVQIFAFCICILIDQSEKGLTKKCSNHVHFCLPSAIFHICEAATTEGLIGRQRGSQKHFIAKQARSCLYANTLVRTHHFPLGLCPTPDYDPLPYLPYTSFPGCLSTWYQEKTSWCDWPQRNKRTGQSAPCEYIGRGYTKGYKKVCRLSL